MFNLPGQTRPTLPSGVALPMAAGGMAQNQMSLPQPIGSFARQSRRLYVGNVTDQTTEESLRHFFNAKLKEMNLLSDGSLGQDLHGLGLKGDEPVINVNLNYEKNYAFVEVSKIAIRFWALSPCRLLFECWLMMCFSSPHSSATLKKRRTRSLSTASSFKTLL